MEASHGGQGVSEFSHQVAHVLDADRQPDQTVADA